MAGDPPNQPESSGDEERIEALLTQAAVARGRGDFRKAEALLDAAEAIAPGEGRVWDLRGDINVDREHYDTAVACYKKALELDPELEDTEDKLGMASLGRMRAAKLAVRAGQEDGLTGKRIRRRSQIAMLASLVFPGLGHLWLELYGRAAAFGLPVVVSLILTALLMEANAEDSTRVTALWVAYAFIGVAIVLWVAAFIDSSRCATLREDEELY